MKPWNGFAPPQVDESSVVHEYVERAPRRQERVAGAIDLSAGVEVAEQHLGPLAAVGIGDLALDLLAALAVAAEQHHVGAACRQREGDSATVAAGRARHHAHPPLQARFVLHSLDLSRETPPPS